MAQNPTSGYGSYANYGFESTYGSAASGTRAFGHQSKITVNRKNNSERIYGLGNRNATATVAKKYEGSVTVEFILSDASFFRAILGTVTDGGTGPDYTHTYAEANTVPSFTVTDGTELGTNDQVSAYLGCKVASATISAAVGELVKVRLECPYKTETLATSGIGSQVAEAYAPFSFAQGSLQLPSGSTIGNVQSIEWTINENLEMLWGLGSRFATAGVEKAREYNLRMTVAFSDVATLLTKFLGNSSAPSTGTPAEVATLVLTFTTGGTGADSHQIVITLANISFDTETLPKDVNEVIKEDVEGWARSCTSVVWTNGTAVDSGSP